MMISKVTTIAAKSAGKIVPSVPPMVVLKFSSCAIVANMAASNSVVLSMGKSFCYIFAEFFEETYLFSVL